MRVFFLKFNGLFLDAISHSWVKFWIHLIKYWKNLFWSGFYSPFPRFWVLNILIPNGPLQDILGSCGSPRRKTFSASTRNFTKDGQMAFSIPVITQGSLQLIILIQLENSSWIRNLNSSIVTVFQLQSHLKQRQVNNSNFKEFPFILRCWKGYPHP